MTAPVTKRMTLTRADVARMLPRAFPDMTVAAAGPDRWLVADAAGRQVSVTLTPAPPVSVGRLRLEAFDVTLAFAGLDPDAAARRLARFERAFQRGGG